MTRAGRAIQLAARHKAWVCEQCGHRDDHLEKPYGTEGYKPAVFHCTHDGCSCVLDRSAA